MLNCFLECFLSEFGGAFVELPHAGYQTVVFLPNGQLLCSQKIFIIDENPSKLTRATLVSLISVSLDVANAILASAIFCLPLRAACNGPVIFIKKAVGKIYSSIIDDFRFLITEQVTVTTVGWNKAFGIFMTITHRLFFLVGTGPTVR